MPARWPHRVWEGAVAWVSETTFAPARLQPNALRMECTISSSALWLSGREKCCNYHVCHLVPKFKNFSAFWFELLRLPPLRGQAQALWTSVHSSANFKNTEKLSRTSVAVGFLVATTNTLSLALLLAAISAWVWFFLRPANSLHIVLLPAATCRVVGCCCLSVVVASDQSCSLVWNQWNSFQWLYLKEKGLGGACNTRVVVRDSIGVSWIWGASLWNWMIGTVQHAKFCRDNARNLGSLKHNWQISMMLLSFRSFFFHLLCLQHISMLIFGRDPSWLDSRAHDTACSTRFGLE